MNKYLVAVALVAAFATPALAADFYLAADLASGKCMVMASSLIRASSKQWAITSLGLQPTRPWPT